MKQSFLTFSLLSQLFNCLWMLNAAFGRVVARLQYDCNSKEYSNHTTGTNAIYKNRQNWSTPYSYEMSVLTLTLPLFSFRRCLP